MKDNNDNKSIDKKEAIDILKTHIEMDFMYERPTKGLEKVLEYLKSK